jgi:hypothetical protein
MLQIDATIARLCEQEKCIDYAKRLVDASLLEVCNVMLIAARHTGCYGAEADVVDTVRNVVVSKPCFIITFSNARRSSSVVF